MFYLAERDLGAYSHQAVYLNPLEADSGSPCRDVKDFVEEN